MPSVKIKIYGHEYLIKHEEGDKSIHEVVDYVNKIMMQAEDSTSKKYSSPKDIAILAVLNIADKYIKIKKKFDIEIADLEKKMEELDNLINI